MCGIIGVIGKSDVSSKILNGLKVLEYRGYDSAGIAVIENGISFRKSLGKLKNLEQELSLSPLCGSTGIGHTRWASHGVPSIENTHPIISQTKKVALVHNGIVENYQELKNELEVMGYSFQTQTDSEVIVALIEKNIEEGMPPLKAVQDAVKKLKGSFAIAVIFSDFSDLVIGAKKNSNFIIGISKENGEYFISSDTSAISNFCDYAVALEDDQSAEITSKEYKIFGKDGALVTTKPSAIDVQSSVSKNGYPTFMLKEIYEQPQVLSFAFEQYKVFGGIANEIDWDKIKRINIIACGTSLYAGHVAKYWLEEAGKSVNLEISSEFATFPGDDYGDQAFIFISQSGETADTLSALKRVREYSSNLIGIVNVKDSIIAKSVNYCIETFAGTEIAVASTKSFMNQLAALASLTVNALGKSTFREFEILDGLKKVLELDEKIKSISSDMLAKANCVLYIGRGCGYPLAMEGALKLKELTYIPAIGMAAGELKHGSIALVDENTPVIAIAPSGDRSFSKMASGINEVKARGGKIILLSDKEGVNKLGDLCASSLELPKASSNFTFPFLYTIPLQLLAHHASSAKGFDVDKPRNLAKSITVE